MRITTIRKTNSGFTLFELLLTVAAFAIIAAIAIPFSNSSIVRGNLDSSVRTVETSLHRAYTYARAGENDSSWGTYITSAEAVVYSGSSYAGRDSRFDEINYISSPVVLGGTLFSGGSADIIFTKGTGIPALTGTITLTAGEIMKTINVNAKGAIIVTTFTPDSLGGLRLWLRADNGITLNGSTVSQWNDQSGSGNHALQGTETSQPLFVPNILNGKPTVRFDGVDDRLAVLNIANLNIDQIRTVFIVVRQNVINSLQMFLSKLDPNGTFENGYSIGAVIKSPASLMLIIEEENHSNWASDLDDQWTYYSNTLALGTDGIKIYKAGNLHSQFTTSYDLEGINDDEFLIGSTANEWHGWGEYFDGDIAEIIIYDSTLSDVDRQVVEAYLANKYAI